MAGCIARLPDGMCQLIVLDMSINSFYCSKCGKRTRHCSISHAEAMSSEAKSTGERIFAGIIGGLGGPVHDALNRFGMGVKSWKCLDCGRISIRNMQGEEG